MQDIDRSEADLALQTLRFYDTNADLYAKQTKDIELTHLYEPFLSMLPKGGKILDVGCGAGRDLKHFADQGFDAVGTDPSVRLSAIAREFSGCQVLVSSVQDLSFDQEFDGAWACASLIHVPRRRLPTALGKIFLSLRSQGVLFVSMQNGGGEMVTEDGRYVALYNAKELSAAIGEAGFELVNLWETPDSLPGRSSIVWVNAIAKKLSD